MIDTGVQRAIRTHTLEEAVLPEVKTTEEQKLDVAVRVRATQSNVRCILYADELHKYHVQRVQSLTPTAYQHRLDQAHWCQLKTIAVSKVVGM